MKDGYERAFYEDARSCTPGNASFLHQKFLLYFPYTIGGILFYHE
jgi:hypothetical protein